jgi:hypothetical protein
MDFDAVEREYLHLNFRVARDGSVELLPSFHLPGPRPPAPLGPEAPIACELRAPDGRSLQFHRCQTTDFNTDRDGPVVEYHEVMPWAREAASVAFLRDGREMGAIALEPEPPSVAAPTMGEGYAADTRMTLDWSAEADDRLATYLVRYSNDAGRSWRAIASRLTEPRCIADLGSLPGGEACMFQVIASSGVRTSIAETTVFSVEVQPRSAFIVLPQSGAEFRVGDSITLLGTGYSADFGTAALDDIAWTSNIDGFIGYGHEVITHTLSSGTHMIGLGVADGLGGEASATVRIAISS